MVRQSLGMFFRRMVVPYASLFILEVGGTSSQIGVVNSLRPLAGLLMFPISGYLTDRASRVRLIALAGYLSAVSMLLYVFAPNWEWIALGSLIQGFMVFQFPPTSAILADSLSPGNRGTGIAAMNSVATGLSLFSPYIAGVLLEMFGVGVGMRVMYGLLACSSLVSAVLVSRYMEESRDVVGFDDLPSLAAILREAYSGVPGLVRGLPGSVKALGVVVLLGFIGNAVASPFWVVYAVEELGLSSLDWGLIVMSETILKTLFIFPAGMLVDRYGRTRNLVAALLVSLFSMPLMACAGGFLPRPVHPSGCRSGRGIVHPRMHRFNGRLCSQRHEGAAGGGTGGPGMGYLFTVPVVAASVVGGLLYSVDPAYTWICLLAVTLMQVFVLVLFVRDPDVAH